MREKSELINISKSMDVSAGYFSFYEFAAKYIDNLKEKKIRDADAFFRTIKTLNDNSGIRANFTAFGKESKNAATEISAWCKMILEKHDSLSGLDIDELHYVMGYCARFSKISSVK